MGVHAHGCVYVHNDARAALLTLVVYDMVVVAGVSKAHTRQLTLVARLGLGGRARRARRRDDRGRGAGVRAGGSVLIGLVTHLVEQVCDVAVLHACPPPPPPPPYHASAGVARSTRRPCARIIVVLVEGEWALQLMKEREERERGREQRDAVSGGMMRARGQAALDEPVARWPSTQNLSSVCAARAKLGEREGGAESSRQIGACVADNTRLVRARGLCAYSCVDRRSCRLLCAGTVSAVPCECGLCVEAPHCHFALRLRRTE